MGNGVFANRLVTVVTFYMIATPSTLLLSERSSNQLTLKPCACPHGEDRRHARTSRIDFLTVRGLEFDPSSKYQPYESPDGTDTPAPWICQSEAQSQNSRSIGRKRRRR